MDILFFSFVTSLFDHEHPTVRRHPPPARSMTGLLCILVQSGMHGKHAIPAARAPVQG
jgi:hypothetical protein